MDIDYNRSNTRSIHRKEVELVGKKKKKETPYWKYPAVRDYMMEYNKMYYQANRDQIINNVSKRNKKNEEKLKVYMKKYYNENRDKLLDHAKKKRKN